MPRIIINETELIETIKTRVGSNGQISIGKKHAGKLVTAYVVLVQGSEQSNRV
ncbi:MAG: hypothetical protein O8C58_01105 [Candidatus Methanoperedens sp.]|nr:hypothetical protein [Candidatus Methanoperedens sp.]